MFDHPEMKHVTQFLQNHLNSILCDATQILCEASKRLRVNEKEKRKKSIEKPIEEIHAVSRNLLVTPPHLHTEHNMEYRVSRSPVIRPIIAARGRC